jgi:Predicted site-specific integrase-resolvase
MPTGTVIIKEPVLPTGSVGLYARVFSSDQKQELEAQLGRLVAYANAQGWVVSRAVTEIGSGLNGHRPKLMKLLADSGVSASVVEHRDRLMRCGAS